VVLVPDPDEVEGERLADERFVSLAPADVVQATRERYREAYRRLTGQELP